MEQRTIFKKDTVNQLIDRLEALKPDTPPLWGKMNVAQMLAHCAGAMDLATGRKTYKRQTIGLLFGWLFKSAYSTEKPFPKNVQTIKGGAVNDTRNFETEKIRLKEAILSMHAMGEEGCTKEAHPIMGKFSPAEWGTGMFKHLDHHFRQFGV